jgi:tRNA dimethylallyltransferase
VRSSRSASSEWARTRCRGVSQGSPTTPELPPLLVIAGATASGKTALAVELVQQLPGAEIVSADSRQVYRGMDIGTAKPSPAERSAAPHHCLDLVDPDERFSLADYQRAALAALGDIAGRGGIALLVGGTGLYLRAIARGFPLETGSTDAALRAALEARCASDGLAALTGELLERDPTVAGTLDLDNPRRVIRALERAILTGSAVPPAPLGYPAPVTWLGLRQETAAHRRAIAARIEAHFAGGLLDEAERLRSRYPEELPAFSAMGYREAFDVLAGRIDVPTAKACDAQRTWAYARRQRTWFRSEPGITWLSAGEGSAAQARRVLSPFLGDIGRDQYAGPA